MFLGDDMSVTIPVSQRKTVACEHCGCRFYYVHEGEASGAGFSPLGLDNENARRRAEKEAREDVEEVRAGISPVRCPDCDLYQSDMIEQMKEARSEPFGCAGALLIYLGLAWGFVAVMSLRDQGQAVKETLMMPALYVPALAGTVLIVIGRLRAARYDPHSPGVHRIRRERFDEPVAHRCSEVEDAPYEYSDGSGETRSETPR